MCSKATTSCACGSVSSSVYSNSLNGTTQSLVLVVKGNYLFTARNTVAGVLMLLWTLALVLLLIATPVARKLQRRSAKPPTAERVRA